MEPARLYESPFTASEVNDLISVITNVLIAPHKPDLGVMRMVGRYPPGIDADKSFQWGGLVDGLRCAPDHDVGDLYSHTKKAQPEPAAPNVGKSPLRMRAPPRLRLPKEL
jgi:hypothetical protein